MNKRYLEIYEDIKQAIQAGKYRVGEKLPSEHEFCQMYGTSRGTVRRALVMLAEEGLVHSMHGKGVYVLDQKFITFSFGGLVSFQEAQEATGQKFSTSVPLFEEIDIDETIHKGTNLPLHQRVYHLYRVRRVDEERIILDINYFLKDIVEGLNEEIAKGSIYEYIEGSLGLKIAFAKRVIQVEPANSRDKKYMDLLSYNYVAVVKNFVYLQDGTQFEYTESRHRPDRFQFTAFVRRR